MGYNMWGSRDNVHGIVCEIGLVILCLLLNSDKECDEGRKIIFHRWIKKEIIQKEGTG